MSVNSSYTPLKQAGNGAQVAFAGTWKILAATDLVCRKIAADGTVGAPGVLNVDYTVVFDSAAETFTVTWAVAPVNLGYSFITRASDETQGTRWPRDNSMPSKANETAVDKLTLLVQEALNWLSRTVGFAPWYSNPPSVYIATAPVDRRALVYAADGAGGFKVIPSTNDPDVQAAAAAVSAAAALASQNAAAASAAAAAASAAAAAAASLAPYQSGTYAAKPAAPATRTLYYSTDRGSLELYIPDAARWYLLG
jgi:hypothetical protein